MKVGELRSFNISLPMWIDLDDERIAEMIVPGESVLIVDYLPYHYWLVLTQRGVRYIYCRNEADEAG